jgi:hypothetical protein
MVRNTCASERSIGLHFTYIIICGIQQLSKTQPYGLLEHEEKTPPMQTLITPDKDNKYF